jgi:hypothetical protein
VATRSSGAFRAVQADSYLRAVLVGMLREVETATFGGLSIRV